jgi:lysyl-tRNA synthetase, class I
MRMLRGFLDGFGFEYEFQSSTDRVQERPLRRDLAACCEQYDEIMAVMLPTLGRAARAATARSCRSRREERPRAAGFPPSR